MNFQLKHSRKKNEVHFLVNLAVCVFRLCSSIVSQWHYKIYINKSFTRLSQKYQTKRLFSFLVAICSVLKNAWTKRIWGRVRWNAYIMERITDFHCFVVIFFRGCSRLIRAIATLCCVIFVFLFMLCVSCPHDTSPWCSNFLCVLFENAFGAVVCVIRIRKFYNAIIQSEKVYSSFVAQYRSICVSVHFFFYSLSLFLCISYEIQHIYTVINIA